MARRNLKDFLADDTLDLSLNDLQEVPVKEIAQFPKATSLDLSNNKLTILSKSFATTLTHLVKLDLARNELKELPKNFGCLVNLKHLDLYKNKLENLPLSFGNLKALRWLDLKENPLEPHWHQIVGPCLNAQDCKNAAKNVVNIAGIMRDEIESEVRSQSRLKQIELEEQEQKEINKKKEKQREKKKRKNAAKLAEANHSNKIENGSTVKVEPISETEEDLSEAPKQSLVRNWSVKKMMSGLFRVLLYLLVTIWLILIVLKFVNEPLHRKIWANISNRNHKLLTSLVPSHTLHGFKRAAFNFFVLVQEFVFAFSSGIWKVWLTFTELLRRSWNFVYSDPRFEIYLQNIIHGFLYLYVAVCNSVSICLTFITSNIQNITS